MWGFLAALGQGLAKAGQGALTGLQYAGKGIGKVGQEIGEGVTTGVKQVAKIPERLKLNRPDPGMARTPGFNPAVDVARGTTGGIPWDAIPPRTNSWGGGRMAGNMMARTQAPIANPTGGLPLPQMGKFNVDLPQPINPPLTGLNWHTPGDAGRNMLANVNLSPAAGALGQAPTRMPLPVRPELNPEGVPIPSLPGRPGGPTPYDPVNKARYDYVMNGAQWEDTGELAGDSNVRLQKPVFKRHWKDALINAGLGAAQEYQRTGDLGSALGGGLAGGVGTAINPQAGREFRFDTLEGPRMEEQRQRQMERAAQDQAQRMGTLREDDLRTQIESRKARDVMEKEQAEREKKTAAALEKARTAQAARDAWINVNGKLFNLETKQWMEVPKGLAAGEGKLMEVEGADGQPAFAHVTAENAPYLKPYVKERSTSDKLSSGAVSASGDVDTLFQEAQQAWDDWAKTTDPVEKEKKRLDATFKQKKYNDAQLQLGADFPDELETAMGKGDWAYRKRKGKQPGRPGSSGSMVTNVMEGNLPKLVKVPQQR